MELDWRDLPEVGAEVVGVRRDGFTSHGDKIRHATFKRLHLKKGEVEGIDFRHTRFLDCYFRHVTFRGCDFTGAVFSDCDMPHAEFIECKLPYSRWRNTRA